MFEYEPGHWTRAGLGCLGDAVELLGTEYQIFSVSYTAGGLVELASPPSVSGLSGRNILALRRTLGGELLGITQQPPVERGGGRRPGQRLLPGTFGQRKRRGDERIRMRDS